MDFNFRIAICSYKRYKMLGNKSLKVLEKYNIPKNIIDIFVNNEQEYEIYRPLYPEYNMIIGETGMKEIREFMFNYYNEGDKIWFMDDDISSFKQKSSSGEFKYGMEHISDLKNIIDLGFNECIKENTILFSVNSVVGNRYLKDNISTKLILCPGWCFGAIIDKECLSLNVAQYEDFERTFKVFKKYGKVIRINYICALQNMEKNEGGMCNDNRINIMKRDLEILKELYSDYFYIRNKPSSLIGVNPTIKSSKKYI